MRSATSVHGMRADDDGTATGSPRIGPVAYDRDGGRDSFSVNAFPGVRPVIALIAHDQKKAELLEFVGRHVDFFRTRALVATGHTGALLSGDLGLTVEQVAHGPYGGDLIIGGRVAEGKVEAVLFFRDPLTAQPHEPDVAALMRVCDVHQVPLPTNMATAEGVVSWLRQQVE